MSGSDCPQRLQAAKDTVVNVIRINIKRVRKESGSKGAILETLSWCYVFNDLLAQGTHQGPGYN